MDKYCRLCLSMTSDIFYDINSVYQKQLEAVIPELNINSVHEPQLCQKCSETLRSAYEFKTRSLEIDKRLRIFVEINNTDVVSVSAVLKIQNELGSDRLEESLLNIKEDETCDNKFLDLAECRVKEEIEDAMEDAILPVNFVECNDILTCQEGFLDVPEFIKDEEIEKKFSEFKCVDCNKDFSTYRQYKRHILYHNVKVTKQYTCDIHDCRVNFSRRLDLVEHKRSHSKFKCSTCGHLSLTYRTYQSHMRKHLGSFKCKTCGMEFSNGTLLKTHEVVHTGVREFICDLCGKSFGQNSTLHTHKRGVHAVEKLFNCEICGKAFAQKVAQKQHTKKMHIETGKRFTCHICGKSVRSTSSLSMHYKRHKGEKAHGCKICGKRFVEPKGLRTHVLIHGNEKPHECPYCSKRTNQKYNLTVHMRTCPKRKEAERLNSQSSVDVVINT